MLGFNNHEPEALFQKLPLCENKHKEMHVCSILLVISRQDIFRDSVPSPATYSHLHMVSPFVILFVDDFKKVPPLSRQPTRQ